MDTGVRVCRPRLKFEILIHMLYFFQSDLSNQISSCHTSVLQNFFLNFIYLFIYLLIYLFIYFWLCWVFVSVRGLSLVAASGGHSSSRCAGLSLLRPLLLRNTGSKRAGSVLVAHGPSCSAACGTFPDQGSNPCPPRWQADSQPLRHQGSPGSCLLTHLPGSLNEAVFSHYVDIPDAQGLAGTVKRLLSVQKWFREGHCLQSPIEETK